jgi:hypothetical protein
MIRREGDNGGLKSAGEDTKKVENGKKQRVFFEK